MPTHLSSKYLFAAKLEGVQEVPAVSTQAMGVASFFLNGTRDTLCVKATLTGLSGPIITAHIHEGAAGVNGPVVLDLMPYLNGHSLTATITGAQLTPAFVSKLLNRMYYINIHTAPHPR